MRITRDGVGHTTLDWEGHITFIKKEQFVGRFIQVDDGVRDTTSRNFHFVVLEGNPLTDCWTLLRWYFRRKV